MFSSLFVFQQFTFVDFSLSQRNWKKGPWTRLCRCISPGYIKWTHLWPDASSWKHAKSIRLYCMHMAKCALILIKHIHQNRAWDASGIDASIDEYGWRSVQLDASNRNASSEMQPHKRVHGCIFQFRYAVCSMRFPLFLISMYSSKHAILQLPICLHDFFSFAKELL